MFQREKRVAFTRLAFKLYMFQGRYNPCICQTLSKRNQFHIPTCVENKIKEADTLFLKSVLLSSITIKSSYE